jgi:putative ABC transport system permease protein
VKGIALLVAITGGIILTIVGLFNNNLTLSGFGIALPFLAMCAFFPLLRRLAVRNASRRPKETILILLGSLLGTAIITSSGVVGDTFAASDRATISQQLGPVDEFVSLPPESRNAVSRYFSEKPNADIDGVLDITQAEGAAGRGGNKPLAIDNARIIEMAFDAAQEFGNDPKATGITGSTPSPGTAVITDDVARDLEIKAGDSIDLYLFGKKTTTTVDRVVKANGLSGLNLDYSSGNSYNVFVAPGTIAPLAGNATFGLDYLTLISNTGDTFGGNELSDKVANLVDTEVMSKLDDSHTRKMLLFGDAKSVTTVKSDRIKEAKEVGTVFRRLFVGIGSFTIIAGILLLINIFTMLAQERQSELGMLRAMGLRRRALIVAFSLEGFLYALGSALFGTIVGLLIGRIVAFVASGIFASRTVGLDLHFHATFTSLERGFVGGLGISMLTVVLASLFIARMNVIRAIRELPDNSLQRKRLLGSLVGVLFVLVGLAMLAIGLGDKNEFLALGGPALLGFGLIMLLRRWVATKPLVTVISILVLLWSIFAFVLAKAAFKDANAGVYVLQGIQLTAFAVSFISANQDYIGSGIRLVLRGPFSMALRLGLAYPLARRGRTGLLLAMYSLVIFVLTFIMTISNALTTSVQKTVNAQSGGADIEVNKKSEFSASDNNANAQKESAIIPADEIAKRPDVQSVAAQFVAPARLVMGDVGTAIRMTSFDSQFVGNGAPPLKERLPQYKTDEDAYKAVASATNMVILDQSTAAIENTRTIKLGDTVTFESDQTPFGSDTGGPPVLGKRKQATFEVVAISFNGRDALTSRPALNLIADANDIELDRAYIKVKSGVDSSQVANELSGLYLANRIAATSIKADVEEGFSVAKQFLMLIQGYMAIGLLVGIAGLGVVMVRAVRERRRQIGMLRAMGFPAHQVRRSFLAESAFIAGEGIFIGAVLALVVLNRTFSALPKDFGIALDVPWIQLLLLIALTFIASILATLAPAQAASRISPAVALRTTD